MPVSVRNPLVLHFEQDVVDEINSYVVDYSNMVAIFHFRGFWPSLSDLHAWISKFWEPIISDEMQIYPMARGFFIVKFANADDRNAILGRGFSWEERFPLMAKPWFPDFNLTTETFNKFPLWVRLPNLPLHFW